MELLSFICILLYDKLIFGVSFSIYFVLIPEKYDFIINLAIFRHISKTVKPKNDFLFFFDAACDSEHINIDPELIWTQNAVCRRFRRF